MLGDLFFILLSISHYFFFFFQAEDGIRDLTVTGVQTCALPISRMSEPQDRKEAWQAASEALRLDPNDASAHALAGKIALEEEEPVKATEQLDRKSVV